MAQASFITNYFSTMVIGKEYHFKIYAYDSSYLHKVVIKCGNYSLTFDRIKGGVETKFTVPTTWGSAMPNTTSMGGTLTLTTYQSNYATQVGANNIKNTTFTVPSYTPAASLTLTDATEGIAAKFGAFVQTKSKVNVTISANGEYGSTIKSYKTTIEGIAYGNETFTSNALTTSGMVTVQTVVTDSRGKTKTITKNINVIPYTPPAIYIFQCNRADDLGQANNEGEYLHTSYHYKIASCNNMNDSSYSIAYKLKEDTDWTTLITGNAYELDEDLTTSVAILDTEESYDLKITLTDYFTTTTHQIDIPTAFTLLDFRVTGKGMGIGKVSEKDMLEIAIPVEIDGQPIQGGAITVYCHGNQRITTNQYTKCNFSSILIQAGNNFTLSNNNVVCKKTGYVEVSGMVSVTGEIVAGDTYYIFAFREDGSGYGTSLNLSTATVGTNSVTLLLTPVIVNVAAGDKIYIAILNNNARGSISVGDNLAWMNKLTVRYVG